MLRTNTATLAMFSRYSRMLQEAGHHPNNNSDVVGGDQTAPEHLLWMCQFGMENLHIRSDVEITAKYSRWLGFVQGILINTGWTTVNEERDYSRKLFQTELEDWT